MASGFRPMIAFKHRDLRHRVEVGSTLKDEVDAQGFSSRFGALVHRDIEGIGRQPGDQGDGVFFVGCGSHIDYRRGDQTERGECCKAQGSNVSCLGGSIGRFNSFCSGK